MKRFFLSVLLVGIMMLTVSLSLAGCGNSTTAKPTDGQVAGEEHVSELGQAIEGTYRTTETPPTGLGTELTLTATGAIKDNTADGEGSYKIEDNHLVITYQSIESRYQFKQISDDVIELDFVTYTKVGENNSELPTGYEPYPSNPDDPWDGLIVAWKLETNRGYENFPTSIIVNPDRYKEYFATALEWFISRPTGGAGMSGHFPNEAHAAGVQLVNRDGTPLVAQPLMTGMLRNKSLPGVGAVVAFTVTAGSWDAELTYTDGTVERAGDIGTGSETTVFYSITTGIILTPQEVNDAFSGK